MRLISPGFVDTRLTRKNRFDMPALPPRTRPRGRSWRDLRGRRFEVHFPRRFTLSMKLLRALPYWASLPLLRRLTG